MDNIGKVGIDLTANIKGFISDVKTAMSTATNIASVSMKSIKSATSSAFSSKEVTSYSKQIDLLQYKLDDIRATLQISESHQGLFGTSEIKEMEAEAEKLQNQINRLKEASGDGQITNNFKQMKEAIKGAFDGSRGKEIASELQNMGQAGISAIRGMAENSDGLQGKILGKIVPAIDKIAPAFSKAIPVVGQVISVVEAVGSTIKTVISVGKKAFEFVQKIDDFMDKILNKIKEYASKFKNLISTVVQGFQKASNFAKKLTGQLTDFENSWTTGLKKVGLLLGTVFGIGQLISFGKESVKTASETFDAWTGLSSIISGQGKSFSEAQKYIESYVSDGLVPLNNTVTAYKNLIASGYTEKETQQLMERLKDASAFGRQSHLTMGEAVQTATEGIKNQNSTLVDNAGVTKNLSVMYTEYAKSIGKTVANLTDEEKRQATVNGIMKETQFQVGDATKATETFSGKVARLSATFTNLKTTVGNVFIPILNIIFPVLQRILEALTSFFNKVSEIMNKIGLRMPKIANATSNAISGIGDSASSTADDISGVGDTAQKTAKKINKAFASVDEINVLNTSKDSGSNGSGGSGSGSGAGAGGLGDDLVFEEVQDEANSLLGGMKKTAFEIGAVFAEGINEGLSKIDWTSIQAKAKTIATNIGEFINGFVATLDWDLLGHTIAEGINTALIFANTLFTTIDFKQIGISFATGLNAMIRDIDWKLLGQTIANYFNISLDYLTGFVTTFDFGQLGRNLATGLQSAINTLHWDNISTILTNGINGAFKTLFEFVTNVNWSDLGRRIYEQMEKTVKGIEWKNIGKTLGTSFNSAVDVLAETVGKKDFWKDLSKSVVDGLNEFIKTVDWKKGGETASNFITGVTGFIKSLLEDVDWETAMDEALEGVDVAQIVADILTIKFDLKALKWQAIGKIVVDGIKDGIILYFKTRFENIGEFVDEYFVEPWKKAFDTKDKDWKEIGKDIIDGIFKGIEGILLSPLELVNEFIFEPIFEAIKMAFGIASPAKKMIPIGENIIKGIFEGIGNLKSWATTKWNEVKTWFGEIKGKVTATFETKKEQVVSWTQKVKAWWGNTKTKVYSTYETTKSNVGSWWTNVKNWWSTKNLNVGSTNTTKSSQVSGWWTNIKNWWGTRKLSVNSSNTTTRSQVSNWWANIKNWWGDKTLSIKIKIGEVVGSIKSWFNTNLIKPLNKKLPSFIPKIPYLAQGSWFAKNNPTLAVVGDNKHEPEIVTPESKIKEQVMEAFKETGTSTKNQQIDLTIKLEYPDGKYLIKEINDAQIKDGRISLLV